MKQNKRRSDCPINLALEIFGDKWTLLILRDIVFFDHTHFNEFVKVEGISTNILTDRLNRLIGYGILSKQVDDKNLSSYVYRLTNKGIDLVPTIIEIFYWGAINTENNNANQNLFQELENNKEAVIERIKSKLRT